MKIRVRLKLLLFTMLLLSTANFEMGAADETARNTEVSSVAEQTPNVVLIFVDDLGYGDVGCYGATKVRTPNIDRLAKEGRRFTDAHSVSAVCTASRYALLTGEYPLRGIGASGGKGIWGPAPVTSGLLVDTEKTTIADVFKNKGYDTGVFGKWHLGFGEGKNQWKQPLRPGPQDLGFDYYFGMPVVNSAPPYVYVENDRVVGADPNDPLVLLDRKNWDRATPITKIPDKAAQRSRNQFGGAKKAHQLFNDYQVGTTLAQKSVQWIKERKGNPFFLYLATTNIHHPFTPAKQFQGTSECGLYGDFIHELDWIVGEVMGCLEENNLADNTLVIFTSDNGGMFNIGGQAAFKNGHRQNGDLLGFKFGVWEGGHRVPFIARWPGKIPAGSTSGQLIGNVDMLATFAAVTGQELEVSQKVDSVNMLPAFVDDPEKPIRDHLVLAPRRESHLSIRKGKWIYIPRKGSGGFNGKKPGGHTFSGPPAVSFIGSENSDIESGRIKKDAPPAQLYDLEADLNQTRNVIKEHPDVVKELASLLEVYLPAKPSQTKPSPKTNPVVKSNANVGQGRELLDENVNAGLSIASPFTDNAVLQQAMPVPIWGKADPNAKVIVEFVDQKKFSQANAEGRWRVELDPLEVSSDPRELIVTCTTTGEKLAIKNIVVGEVWICSGQSNMQMETRKIPEVKALIPSAKNLRTFLVKQTVAFDEQDHCVGHWKQSHPDSAVAFAFSFFLEKHSSVPVGIVQTCWGSSSIEGWMPRDMMQNLPHFNQQMQDFDADQVKRARVESILNGPKPWGRKNDIFLRTQPNILYNAMMHPLAPMACRGIVWYQGEANTKSIERMLQYGKTLPAWIQRYREEWGREDLHFMVVMLPGYARGLGENSAHPWEGSWAWMRESQLQVLDLPHTSVANTIDLGHLTNIHPTDKLPIGKRLARLAARDMLGHDIEARGPVFKQVENQGEKLIVHFSHSTGMKTIDGRPPTGFWLADDTRNWVRADAVLSGETVVLSSSKLAKPLFVRYAFAGKPHVNLVNQADLPAFPFRSDNFDFKRDEEDKR